MPLVPHHLQLLRAWLPARHEWAGGHQEPHPRGPQPRLPRGELLQLQTALQGLVPCGRIAADASCHSSPRTEAQRMPADRRPTLHCSPCTLPQVAHYLILAQLTKEARARLERGPFMVRVATGGLPQIQQQPVVIGGALVPAKQRKPPRKDPQQEMQ